MGGRESWHLKEAGVIKAPCIQVPAPKQIQKNLFPQGVANPVSLPSIWTARILLTPFGGLKSDAIVPGDQLVIGNLTYEATSPTDRYMRVGLYLFESLQYYDFFFKTSGTATQWWWLVSDPSNPNGLPTKTFGPFPTTAIVPARDFLATNAFSHAGTWKVLGRSRDSFSARRNAKAGTWYWFDAGSNNLARIMNVDSRNDFQIAVLGAHYLADLTAVEQPASSMLGEVHKLCTQATVGPGPVSPMVTLPDLLNAMAAPPSGSQVRCTVNQIQALIPGISAAKGSVSPPSWTNKVNSECYMIGQDTYPYYCQVWYDWDRGEQVTVFVQQDDTGSYNARFDEILPKGAVGPAIGYSWDGSQWTPACCQKGGSFVSMPVPNFVEAGSGQCRALFRNDPYFGTMSIWTVALGDSNKWSDFWYWFNDRQQGVIFSLAPARSLTIIDYQTFVQNGMIEACIFENPCDQLPPCSEAQIVARAKSKFVIA